LICHEVCYIHVIGLGLTLDLCSLVTLEVFSYNVVDPCDSTGMTGKIGEIPRMEMLSGVLGEKFITSTPVQVGDRTVGHTSLAETIGVVAVNIDANSIVQSIIQIEKKTQIGLYM